MDMFDNIVFVITATYNLFNKVLSVELFQLNGESVNGWSVVIGTFVGCEALAYLFTFMFPDDFTTDTDD